MLVVFVSEILFKHVNVKIATKTSWIRCCYFLSICYPCKKRIQTLLAFVLTFQTYSFQFLQETIFFQFSSIWSSKDKFSWSNPIMSACKFNKTKLKHKQQLASWSQINTIKMKILIILYMLPSWDEAWVYGVIKCTPCTK